MRQKTAMVFGATGLVGSELVKQLMHDERYSEVLVFARRDPVVSGGRLRPVITDVSDIESYADKLTGDDLFICLGTTIRKAGSVKAMEVIDRDIPAAVAAAAKKNGASAVAVVSSIGADTGSRNYYLRIKGEMEHSVLAAGFGKTIIVRPSILLGKREEFRFGEEAGRLVMRFVGPLLTGRMRKYRGIEARQVAAAMIRLINSDTGNSKVIFESDEL